MDFKFASHGLWSEKQNILPQHMLKKEFWILTNKCGNNHKHENEAEWPWLDKWGDIFVYSNSAQLICVEINCAEHEYMNVYLTYRTDDATV